MMIIEFDSWCTISIDTTFYYIVIYNAAIALLKYCINNCIKLQYSYSIIQCITFNKI